MKQKTLLLLLGIGAVAFILWKLLRGNKRPRFSIAAFDAPRFRTRETEPFTVNTPVDTAFNLDPFNKGLNL